MNETYEEHLSDEDFERLALGGSSHDPFLGGETDADRSQQFADAALTKALRHIEICEVCRETARRNQAATRMLNQLRSQGPAAPRADCPSASEWPLVVTGQVESEQAREYLRHAEDCDHCGTLLREATVDFGDEFTADEEEMISQLKTSDPAWQKQFARELAAKSPAPAEVSPGSKAKVLRGPWLSWRNWQPVALAAAATVIVAVLLFVFLNNYYSQRPNKLLAQAYGERRNLELRFQDAQHGPVHVERSKGGDSRLNRPAALLEAEALIARGLEQDPNSLVWLQAKGRADLLEGNYEAAIQSFQKALDLDVNSASLQTDLASAYFQRAELADRASDYGRAIELLSKVLAQNPNDPIARFNRALVNEKMFLYRQALEDWEHYLQLDAKGEWANEATQHINNLRQKLNEQTQSATQPLLDPATFVREIDQAGKDALTRRSEDYLDTAVREWLPAATSDAAKAPATTEALARLAVMLRDTHQDSWLSDIMTTPPSKDFSRALAALAEAANANATGDFARAESSALRARQLFQDTGSRAGKSRSQLEIVYALDRSGQSQNCLAASDLLAPDSRGYPWIEIQLFLERSNCVGQMGKFSEAERALKTSVDLARKSAYATVSLRALGLAASLQTDHGNVTAAAALDHEGLERYWNGVYPPIRAYQFYSDLGFHAEKREQWNFALILAKEAVASIALSPQRLGEAFARHRLAKTAIQTGDTALAIAEFDRARQLFNALPQTEVTINYQADGEIELAGIEAERGNLDQSWAHLSTARAQLPKTTRYFTALNFYKTLGELQHLKGNQPEAEKAFRAALAVTERGLASLQDEREREVWVRDTLELYRAIAEIRWDANDIQGALAVWEWYRSAALRKEAAETVPGSSPPGIDASIDLASLDAGPPLAAMPQVREPADLKNRTELVYLQTSKRLLIWLRDEQGVTGKQVRVTRDELQRLGQRFSEKCGNPNSDLASLQKNARQLYDLLIGPVADRLPRGDTQTLVIETDQSLAGIPLTALLDAQGQYLGEAYDIVLSRGLPQSRSFRSTTANISANQRALIVGSPALTGDLADSLEPLGDALQEANYVGSKFKTSTLLTGRQATLETVRNKLPESELFHFAGHALTLSEHVGLLLARSDSQNHADAGETAILDSNGLASLNLSNIQLAVFSACSTAKNENAGEASAESLVNLFLRAGVAQVLATRWNVDSRITARFMQVFYDNLLAGASVISSLRVAELQLRTNAETRHPYYWAAFAVFAQ